MMKKIFSLLLIIAISISLCGCGSDNTLSDLHHVKIDIKDYGVIEVELDANEAPITVNNFIDLVKDGFYDGLIKDLSVNPDDYFLSVKDSLNLLKKKV